MIARDTLAQFLRFALVGVAGFLVDAGVLTLLLRAGVQPYVARVLSFASAASCTWVLNRVYTFRSRGRALGEWQRFLLVNTGGGLINYGVYSFVIHRYGAIGWLPVLGVALGSLSGLLFNFTLSRALVFRGSGGRYRD